MLLTPADRQNANGGLIRSILIGFNRKRGRFVENLPRFCPCEAVIQPQQFYQICHCEEGACARRGNLKAEGMASRGEAREHETKGKPYHKKHGNRCVVLRPHSLFQGSVSFRATIFRFGMTNRIVKDCRVGRTRPPRNDRIGRLDRKYETQNPIFRFRKTFLICWTDFDGSGLF